MKSEKRFFPVFWSEKAFFLSGELKFGKVQGVLRRDSCSESAGVNVHGDLIDKLSRVEVFKAGNKATKELFKNRILRQEVLQKKFFL